MWDIAFALKGAFPSCLNNEINHIIEHSTAKLRTKYPIKTFSVTVNNEIIYIPERHDLSELLPISPFERVLLSRVKLNELQAGIANCFYSRHCDGYIREKNLKKIIQIQSAFIVPYIIRLLGEYVIEILQVIYQNREFLNIDLFREFVRNNKSFYELSRQRMISYRSCYYRWLYKYEKDYVGYKIFDYLDSRM